MSMRHEQAEKAPKMKNAQIVRQMLDIWCFGLSSDGYTGFKKIGKEFKHCHGALA